MSACAGAGRRWTPGLGRAVCPVCKVSSGTLGVTDRHDRTAVQRLLREKALVPAHEHAASRAG